MSTTPHLFSVLACLGLAALTTACSTEQPHTKPAEMPKETPQATHTNDAQRVLFVLTSHKALGDTGRDTGYFLSEVSHAYYVIKDANLDIHFASIQGGAPPMDGTDREDEDNTRFLKDTDAMKALEDTTPLSKVDPSAYAAVYYPGGHGTMWDFPGNPDIQRITREVWDKGGVVAAVCHGPAALTEVKLGSGEFLVSGRKVAAFTNEEESAVNLTDTVPFLLQSRLQERGAEVLTADKFQTQVVVDGQLVTGQNPASAREAAEQIVKLLQANTTK